MGCDTHPILLLKYVYVHLLYNIVLVYLYHTKYMWKNYNTIPLAYIYIYSPIKKTK